LEEISLQKDCTAVLSSIPQISFYREISSLKQNNFYASIHCVFSKLSVRFTTDFNRL